MSVPVSTVATQRSETTTQFKFFAFPKCTLREDYGKYMEDKLLCDMQFVLGTEETKIMCHIAFVAARSEYLRAMILAAQKATQMENKSIFVEDQVPLLEVKLPNVQSEAFKHILNYIYTDRIHFNESSDQNIIKLIIDVYELADLFVMRHLMGCCIYYVETKINVANVLEALVYSDKKKIKIVAEHCMQFLIQKEILTGVVLLDEFSHLDAPILVDITRNIVSSLVNDSGHENERDSDSETEYGSDVDIIDINQIEKSTALESDMAAFLESTGKDFCNIDLVLNGQVIKAHKCILSARSQYFQAMFRSFMPSDNQINISMCDVLPSIEAFHVLLRYIYCGETKFHPQDALYLLQAPNFYGLSNNRLHSFCKYHLERNITFKNVLQTLEAADYTKNFDIKQYSLKLISQNFAVVTSLPEISRLSRELLLEVISCARSVS